MGSLMVGEEQGLTEGFPALLALPGLLLAVNPLVSVKVGAAPEALPTVDAQKRPLPGVDSEMLQQACVLAEHFGAFLALIGLLTTVGLLMSDKV